MLSRALHSDPRRLLDTGEQPAIHAQGVAQILELAMRIGSQLLMVGASANEATVAMTTVAKAYGLKGVQVDVTFHAVHVSYLRSGERSMTLMRVVRVSSPDYSKYQRLQGLVARIEGGMGLDEARAGSRGIRRTPFRYRTGVVVVARSVVAVGVGIRFDGSPVILALTFLAALAASITQAALARASMPPFFRQIAGGFVITIVAVVVAALASLGVEPFTTVRPEIIVAAGIVLMFSGLALVGAVKDAIEGFSLTAGGRILDVMLQTLGVVIGIFIGLELGRLLGYGISLPDEAAPQGTVTSVLIGAVIVAAAVSISNGADSRIVLFSAALSVLAAVSSTAAVGVGLGDVGAAALGALAASFAGTFLGRSSVPSVAVSTAAIIALVPGGVIFRGLLEMVTTSGTLDGTLAGVDLLAHAAMIAVALAVGASLGSFLAGTRNRPPAAALAPPLFARATRSSAPQPRND